MFVAEPSDVPDTAVRVSAAASMLVCRGESGSNWSGFSDSARFCHLHDCFLPQDSSEFDHFEERTEVRGTAVATPQDQL